MGATTTRVIPLRAEPARRGPRATPKGRQVQPSVRERVQALCAGLAPRRDLLIEHLHRLQDAEGALRKGHLAALAEHLRLSQVEVFEVASFYHHFQVVEDDAEVPATVVRVCSSLSCAMAGGESLLAVRQRISNTASELAARHLGQQIVLVAHGGVLDALYRAATGQEVQAPRTWQLGNAAINRLLWTPEGMTLVGWSDTRHLEDSALDEVSA